MTWWLSVFFFINGHWVPGSAIEGWQPRPYATEAHCMERRAFAEKECRERPLKYEAVWMCTKGAPATEPPDMAPAIEC